MRLVIVILDAIRPNRHCEANRGFAETIQKFAPFRHCEGFSPKQSKPRESKR